MICEQKCVGLRPSCDGYCFRCGWEKAEADRRMEMLQHDGLTKCKDGLERLIIKRRRENG